MGKSKNKYKVYNGKIIKEFLENSRFFILIALFAFGIIFGAVTIGKSGNITNEIKELISNFTMLRAGQGMLENFCNSLFVNLFFGGCSVFLAFSIIGYPFIMILPFVRGVAVGAVSGYLYSAYKLTGLGYSLLMIYPAALISVTALIFIFNESCEYSSNAYLKSITGKGIYKKDETKIFLIRQLIFIGITAAGALIDAVSAMLFSRFFVF